MLACLETRNQERTLAIQVANKNGDASGLEFSVHLVDGHNVQQNFRRKASFKSMYKEMATVLNVQLNVADHEDQNITKKVNVEMSKSADANKLTPCALCCSL